MKNLLILVVTISMATTAVGLAADPAKPGDAVKFFKEDVANVLSLTGPFDGVLGSYDEKHVHPTGGLYSAVVYEKGAAPGTLIKITAWVKKDDVGRTTDKECPTPPKKSCCSSSEAACCGPTVLIVNNEARMPLEDYNRATVRFTNNVSVDARSYQTNVQQPAAEPRCNNCGRLTHFNSGGLVWCPSRRGYYPSSFGTLGGGFGNRLGMPLTAGNGPYGW